MTAAPAGQSGSVQRVRLLLEARRWDEAVAALGPVLAAAPGEAEPYCLLAQAHLGARRPPDAAAAAGQALAVEPASTWAHRLYALALHNAGQDAPALASARWLTSVEPDEWRSWWVLSVVARGLGLQAQPEALAAATRAVALAPDNADTHDALASTLLAAGRLDDAEASFRRALAINPADPFAHNGLGQLALRRRDPAAAAVGFRRALSADPRESAARHNLQVALQQAARPLALTIWVCALALRFVTDSRLSDTTVRLAAAVAALVATGTLVRAVRRFLARLDPSLRGFYRRLVLEDRRLGAGVALHLVAVLTIYLVIVLPRAADDGLWGVAVLAVLLGRVLFFRGGWRRRGVRRRS